MRAYPAVLLTALLLLASGCPPSTATGKKRSTGPQWRDTVNGVQVYLSGPPGGVKRTIGTVYADAATREEAIDALTMEAQRLRADAIYGVTEADLPGTPRRAGTAGSYDPVTGQVTPGNFESERHHKSWQATAVILEPVSPSERLGKDDDEGDGDADDDADDEPEPDNPKADD